MRIAQPIWTFAFVVVASAAAGLLTANQLTDQKENSSVSPRYSVDYAGQATLIVDNQTNQLYVYAHTANGLRLQNQLDLQKVGEDRIPGLQTTQQQEK